MKRNTIVHVHQAEKMTCAELASAIDAAKQNVKRYSDLKESSAAIQKAAEEHFISLLKSQVARAI